MVRGHAGIVCRILVALLFCFACSCRRGADYFPLKNGLQWDYDVQVSANGTVQHGTCVSRIDGEENVEGTVYFKNVWSCSIPELPAMTTYYTKGNSGVWALSGDRKHRYIALPEPAAIGREWKGVDAGGEFSARIESLETARLSTATYDGCYKVVSRYRTDKGDGTASFYVAPGIGTVHQVFTLGGVKLEFSLTKYSS